MTFAPSPLLRTTLPLALLLAAACGPSDPPPRFPPEREVLAAFAARLDLDGDGRIQQAEYEVFSNRREPFASLDLDGDGSLDLAELTRAVRGVDPTRQP